MSSSKLTPKQLYAVQSVGKDPGMRGKIRPATRKFDGKGRWSVAAKTAECARAGRMITGRSYPAGKTGLIAMTRDPARYLASRRFTVCSKEGA